MRRFPVAMWLGIGLIVGTSVAHFWLELDRGFRIAPQLKKGPEAVARNFEVIAAAQSLQRALQDAERGQRGFLLTGKESYLEPYHKGVAEVPAAFAKLRSLTAGDTEQQRRWPALEHQIGVKLSELKRTLEARQARGLAAALQTVETDVGEDAIKSINGILDAAIQAERATLIGRLATGGTLESEGRLAALIGALLELAALVLGAALLIFAVRTMRTTEVARREADQRLRYFVNGVVDYAIYMLDPGGRIMDWNAGAERIKGYSAKEAVGQDFSMFYTPDDRAAGVPQAVLEQAAREGRFEAEAWRVRKDGTRFMASVVIDALRDPAGKLIGFAKVTRDIDTRIQQQAALAQYQKMDAIGQLTGGIAHDFNNLLHVIRNAVDILERRLRDITPEVRKYLDMLKRNADRAAALTARLLAFSRRQMLDPKPIDPNALLADLGALLRQVLGENIAVEAVAGAGAWWIAADANQLETAILNLAVNARDAMPAGGKLTLEVSNALLDETYAAAQLDVKPGQYVMIAVSDTGTGMSAEVARKAFDPFFTTKELGQGTGLGLSQVYGFAKQSGGHAAIYSEPGEGSTIKLYLPRAVGGPAAAHGAPTQSAVHGGGSGTVLLVEDDTDVRQFTAETLGDLGYRVLTAGDAADALETLEREKSIDLLFTDIGLPGGVNGRKLADEAVRRFPSLKVLFTTGYTRNAVIHHNRLDPGVQLIVKPFTQAGLADKVKNVLETR